MAQLAYVMKQVVVQAKSPAAIHLLSSPTIFPDPLAIARRTLAIPLRPEHAIGDDLHLLWGLTLRGTQEQRPQQAIDSDD